MMRISVPRASPPSVAMPRQDFRVVRHVILDRDGVLNHELPRGEVISRPEQFWWIEHSRAALAKMRALGLRISVATNQSSIGRGLLTESALQVVHQKMSSDARAVGGAIDGIFYCPHVANDHCECRKPAGGLISAATADAGILAVDTLVVGDDVRDLDAASCVGASAAPLRTGKGVLFEALAASRGIPVFDNLDALADSLGRERASQAARRDVLMEAFHAHTSIVQEAANELIPSLERCIAAAIRCLKDGNKIMVCGNGGSAADAQHFVAELVGRYQRHRSALAAIVLGADAATFTAIANDFGFEALFARQIQALAHPGNVLIVGFRVIGPTGFRRNETTRYWGNGPPDFVPMGLPSGAAFQP